MHASRGARRPSGGRRFHRLPALLRWMVERWRRARHWVDRVI